MLEKKLQKLYFLIIAPAFLIIFLFFVAEKFDYKVGFNKGGRFISTVIMLFTVISSIILPVWYKILLFKKFRNDKKINFETFAGYQYRIIITVTFSIYWIFPAYLYQLEEMPLVIIGFFILYGLYYYYPTKKKIDAEKKLFKIDE